ncbi:MAG: hypothetical protein ACK528_09700, partial [Alphaproteobacteria bacterium]
MKQYTVIFKTNNAAPLEVLSRQVGQSEVISWVQDDHRYSGRALEEVAGLKAIENADGDFVYERKLTQDEAFEAAVEALQAYGEWSFYEVGEHD